MRSGTRARYGTWAMVAGASEGLGAAFAEGLAAQGHDVVLLARRVDKLAAVEAAIRARHNVAVLCVAVDLGAADAATVVTQAVCDREIGVLVCNAAFAPLGDFLAAGPAAAMTALDVNCRATLALIHAYAPAMVARKRGAILLMSSLTAFQGTPWTAVYGATKAFGLTLAEGLWLELGPQGVDVLAVCAGATRTPNYLARAAEGGAPGELEPEAVVAEALAALGRAPMVIPGAFNRFASFLMRRVLPRAMTVRIMEGQTRKLR